MNSLQLSQSFAGALTVGVLVRATNMQQLIKFCTSAQLHATRSTFSHLI